MIHTIVIDSVGNILRNATYYIPVNIDALSNGEIAVSAAVDREKQYYDIHTKQVKTKVESNYTVGNLSVLSDGQSTIIITGLPSPSEISLDYNPVGIITDGTLELTFDIPGEHVLEITNPLYLKFTRVINAT